MINKPVIVIGGGIAGLTAASLLAHEGIDVTLLESHNQLGGCAGTFRRGSYVFDVGATQVAGLEKGGIHERLFRHLGVGLPDAELLDPCCLVDLGDGLPPINVWYDPQKWQEERLQQFPGSELFWSLCSALHKSNWAFAQRDPVVPIASYWDLRETIKALEIANLPSIFFSKLSVADLLRICSCHTDLRLRQFLDLQLKLYSQEPCNRTAALYGATVLQIAQAPHGLWHLHGSMQMLSEHLKRSLLKNGARLLLNHRVVGLEKKFDNQSWKISIIGPKNTCLEINSPDIVCSLTPQSLISLLHSDMGEIRNYLRKLRMLPKPSGAIVFYGALSRLFLDSSYPPHIQLSSKKLGSIFISVSRDGDGRAPLGVATLIVSIFTKTQDWCHLDEVDYQKKKQLFLHSIIDELENWFGIETEHWLHQELATPRSFQKWIGRPDGIVGGLGQHPSVFGPFGLSSRTPIGGLWLCGDSIYPGEGTAGVTNSALMACRQLMANRGLGLNLEL